jgi:hypothetical protein
VAIFTARYYFAECDGCRVGLYQRTQPQFAREDAANAGWVWREGRVYCAACQRAGLAPLFGPDGKAPVTRHEGG